MPNMLSYLEEYGDIALSKRPFSKPDAMLLAQLSYCKFDNLVLGDEPVYMRDLILSPESDEMFADPKYEKSNKTLVARMIMGRRFRNIRLSRYVNIVDKETETQFSAITIGLPGGTSFVAFRGTDESMVGWKEDFNLSYMDEVPGQKYSCMYLQEASEHIKGHFYVGGHSKGGHLAIYSSMHAPESIKKRIINVFCMDGPGFMDRMMNKEGYAQIRDRIIKIIPQFSVIGLMQERDEIFEVVRSITWGLHQHNMYTWEIRNGEIEKDNLKEGARFLAETLNEWMLQQSYDQRQKAAEIAYQIMTSSEADNRIDFMSNFTKNATQIIAAVREMDPDAAELSKALMGSLMSDMTRNIRNELETAPPVIREWLDDHIPGWMDKIFKKEEQ